MIASVYFRPWVLVRAHANHRVPHLANLDVVMFPRWDKDVLTQNTPMRRRRSQKKTSLELRDWDLRQRSYHEAWRRYIRGGVVSLHAERLIRNFLHIMAGSGNHADEDELTGTNHRRREDFGDAGTRYSLHDVHDMLRPDGTKRPEPPAEDPKAEPGAGGTANSRRCNYISARIEKDFAMVDHLDKLVRKAMDTAEDTPLEKPASAFDMPLPKKPATGTPTQKTARVKKGASVYTRNYRQKYTTWKSKLEAAEKLSELVLRPVPALIPLERRGQLSAFTDVAACVRIIVSHHTPQQDSHLPDLQPATQQRKGHMQLP